MDELVESFFVKMESSIVGIVKVVLLGKFKQGIIVHAVAVVPKRARQVKRWMQQLVHVLIILLPIIAGVRLLGQELFVVIMDLLGHGETQQTVQVVVPKRVQQVKF